MGLAPGEKRAKGRRRNGGTLLSILALVVASSAFAALGRIVDG
jgi:hypothetical protein